MMRTVFGFGAFMSSAVRGSSELYPFPDGIAAKWDLATTTTGPDTQGIALNEDWTAAEFGTTSGQTDPAGGSNAFTINATSASAVLYHENYNQDSNGNITYDVWIKAGTASVFDICAGDDESVIRVNASTGTISSTSGDNYVSSGVTGPTSSFYKFSMTFSPTTTQRISIKATTTGTSDVYMTKDPIAQVGSTQADSNFDNWTKNAVTVTSGISDPDGGTAAYRITDDTATAIHRVRYDVSARAGRHALRVRLRSQATITTVTVHLNQNDNQTRVVLDLSGGSITTAGTDVVDSTLVSLGGGWYDLWFLGNVSGGANIQIMLGTGSYTGTGAGAIDSYLPDNQQPALPSDIELTSGWTDTNLARTGGQADPNGELFGYLLTDSNDASSKAHTSRSKTQTTQLGRMRMVASMKAGTLTYAELDANTAAAFFSLSDGSDGGATGTYYNLQSTSLGSGWYDVAVDQEADGTHYCELTTATGFSEGSYQGDGTGTLTVANVRIEYNQVSQSNDSVGTAHFTQSLGAAAPWLTDEGHPEYDGVNDVMVTTYKPNTTKGTLYAWVKPDSGGSGIRTALGCEVGANGCWVGIDGNGIPCAHIGSSGPTTIRGTIPLPTGEWSLLIATWDSAGNATLDSWSNAGGRTQHYSGAFAGSIPDAVFHQGGCNDDGTTDQYWPGGIGPSGPFASEAHTSYAAQRGIFEDWGEFSVIEGTFSAAAHASNPFIDATLLQTHGYAAGERDNINGPTVLPIPSFIASGSRPDPTANYYWYFAHHDGDFIKLGWSATLTGTITLYDATSPTVDQGCFRLDSVTDDFYLKNPECRMNEHVASPEVYVDTSNSRLLMLPHARCDGTVPPSNDQVSPVLTSADGLSWSALSSTYVVPVDFYARVFEVGGRKFAFSNNGELWRAPTSGEWDEGYLTWDNVDDAENPLLTFYTNRGGTGANIRHSAVLQRTGDTNVYVFYTTFGDAPERVYLTVIDTNSGSTDPSTWRCGGQRELLRPASSWEGTGNQLVPSASGKGTGKQELRDPYPFVDASGNYWLAYTGAGEEAIGLAQLTFASSSNEDTGTQGALYTIEASLVNDDADDTWTTTDTVEWTAVVSNVPASAVEIHDDGGKVGDMVDSGDGLTWTYSASTWNAGSPRTFFARATVEGATVDSYNYAVTIT